MISRQEVRDVWENFFFFKDNLKTAKIQQVRRQTEVQENSWWKLLCGKRETKPSQYQWYLISATVHKILNLFPLLSDLLQESLTFKSNELMELRNYTGNITSDTEKE